MKKIKVKHIAATMLTLTVISGILFSGIKNMRVRAMPEAGSTEVARQISDESIVLLKNSNQVLPLKMGSNIALFGDAQVLAYKMASSTLIQQPGYIPFCAGSSFVVPGNNTQVGPLEALREFERRGTVHIYEPLAQRYEGQQKFKGEYTAERRSEFETEYVPTAEEYRLASEFADTAVVFLRRWGGECVDYTPEAWELTGQEKTMLLEVSARFEKVIVVLNTGTPMDVSWAQGEIEGIEVDALLYAGYGGYQGGYGIADVLLGVANPSGKLTATWAKEITDYPSTESFLASMAIQEYTEDIFVGYRYFETIPGAKEKVAYPFGYGLSYTTFEITQENFKTDSETVTVTVKVKNTGTLAGKEIVQCYFSAPQKGVGEAVLDKSFIELCAFDKTELLQPGQEQLITLCFKIADMASYDAEGETGYKSAYVLEKGEYTVYTGNSVRALTASGVVEVEECTVTQQLSEQCPGNLTKRLMADGTFVTAEDSDDFAAVVTHEEAVTIQAENFMILDGPTVKVFRDGSLFDSATAGWRDYAGEALGDTYMKGACAIYKLKVEDAGYYDISFRAASRKDITANITLYTSRDNSEYTQVTVSEKIPDTYTLANTYNSAFSNLYHNYIDVFAQNAVFLEQGIVYIKLTFENYPNVDSFTLVPKNTEIIVDKEEVVEINGASYGLRGGMLYKEEGVWSPVFGEYLMHLSNSGAYVIYAVDIPQEGEYAVSFRLSTTAASHNRFVFSVSNEKDGLYRQVPMSINLPNTSTMYTGNVADTYYFAFIDTESVLVHFEEGINYIKLTGGGINTPNFSHVLIETAPEDIRYMGSEYFDRHSALKDLEKGTVQFCIQDQWYTYAGNVQYIANQNFTAGRYVTYQITAPKTGMYQLTLRYGSAYDNAYIRAEISADNIQYAAVGEDVLLANTFRRYQEATGDATNLYQYATTMDTDIGLVPLQAGTNYLRLIMPQAEGPNIESFLLSYSGKVQDDIVVEDGTGIAEYLLKDVYNGVVTMEQFVDQMTNDELATFSVLHRSKSAGTTKSVRDKYGIENIILDNTPSGIITGTCFPSQTAMASTWNLKLARAFAMCVAAEALQRGYDIWEAPAVNLQRNPLGGRYNEYYSEDPYLSGIFAVIVVQTVQENGVGVCLKHFTGNEKEAGKTESDTRVSERALRELYLKPFEMVVKEAAPWSIMSAYNKLNGTYSSENYALLQNILREEWGFEGFVTADWNGKSDVVQGILARNNMHPRTAGDHIVNINEDILKVQRAIQNGTISRELAEQNAAEILKIVLKTQNFIKIHIEPDGRSLYSTEEAYGVASIPQDYKQKVQAELSAALGRLGIEGKNVLGLQMQVVDPAACKESVYFSNARFTEDLGGLASVTIHNTFASGADLKVMFGIFIRDGKWTRVCREDTFQFTGDDASVRKEGTWLVIPAGCSATLVQDFSDIQEVQGYDSDGNTTRKYGQQEFNPLFFFQAESSSSKDIAYIVSDTITAANSNSSADGIAFRRVLEEKDFLYASWQIVPQINGISESAREMLAAQGLKVTSGNPFTENVYETFVARAEDNQEYIFEGWYDADGNLISKDKVYVYTTRQNENKMQTIYARYTTESVETTVSVSPTATEPTPTAGNKPSVSASADMGDTVLTGGVILLLFSAGILVFIGVVRKHKKEEKNKS